MDERRENAEILFSPEVDVLYRLLDPEVCEYKRAGEPFTLRETDELGKAAVTVETDCPCFAVCSLDCKGTLPFFKKDWDALTKCADHIVFLFDRESGKWSVHIFEMKLSLDEKKWNDKIVKQFSGAAVRACAIGGILRIPDFAGIYLHCCYCEYKVNRVEKRTHPGKPAPKDFLKEPVKLKTYPDLPAENSPVKMERGDEIPNARVRLSIGGCTVLSPQK